MSDNYILCAQCAFEKRCSKKRFEIVVDGKSVWVCYRQFIQLLTGVQGGEQK